MKLLHHNYIDFHMLFIMLILNITVALPMYWKKIQIRLSKDMSKPSSADETYTKSVIFFFIRKLDSFTFATKTKATNAYR